MKKLLAGILGFGLWCGPALWAAQPQNSPPKEPKKQQMSEDMREAIAFERAKDAADARQARLEARHPSVPAPGSENSANRSTTPPQDGKTVKDKGPKKDQDK